MIFQVALNYIHSWLDWCLGFCKLMQNREVGWLTVDRKVINSLPTTYLVAATNIREKQKQTGKQIRERQPIMKKIKLIILFNPLMTWVDRLPINRKFLHHEAVKYGKEESSSKSKSQIKQFVEFFEIDMQSYDPSDIDAYPVSLYQTNAISGKCTECYRPSKISSSASTARAPVRFMHPTIHHTPSSPPIVVS